MAAVYRLISFQMEPPGAIWNYAALVIAAIVIGALAISRFRDIRARPGGAAAQKEKRP